MIATRILGLCARNSQKKLDRDCIYDYFTDYPRVEQEIAVIMRLSDGALAGYGITFFR